MNQLNVKTSKMQFILIGLLGVFFVPAGVWMLIKAVLNKFELFPLVFGVALLATFSGILWLVLRGYSKSIKSFTDEGLTRNDGKQLAWTNLSRVVNQIRLNPGTNRKQLWRTEIQFSDGAAAWLIPSKIVNLQEVTAFVNNLPCEHGEVNV